MDLTRAKTALILAFLALNLYLGYQLWYSTENYLSYLTVTSGEVEEVLGQLEEYNYHLSVPLPRQSYTMSLLSVQARDLDHEELVQALFAGGEPAVQEQEGETVYTGQEGTLVFPGKGRALYTREGPAEDSQPEGQELQSRGEEFLEEKGLLLPGANFGGLYPGPGDRMRALYFQAYEGFSLYTSFLELHFQGDQVAGFEIYWLEPLEYSGESRYVLPATQALRRFLELAGPAAAPEEITGLSLGYFSRDYDAQRWDVVPVWRITGASGWVVYINAFSGEEETS